MPRSFCRPILLKAKPKAKTTEKAPEVPKKDEPKTNGDAAADADMPDLEPAAEQPQKAEPEMDID